MTTPLGTAGDWRRVAVAVVSRGDLFPAHHGAAVKIERSAWGMSFHVRALCLVLDQADRYFVYRRGQRSEHAYPQSLVEAPPGDAASHLRTLGVPASDAFLYRPLFDPAMARRLAHVARRHRIGVFQAEFPAYARPCLEVRRALGGRVVLVEHNVEFDRLAELNPGLAPSTRRWLRRTEVSLCNAADVVVTASERDLLTLTAAGVSPGKLRVVPHGVDLDAYRQARPLDLHRRYRIPPPAAVLVYHGVYRYQPNREAVSLLAQQVLPFLHAWGYPAWLVAIGADPPGELVAPYVTFTGPVDDLPAHLLGADVAVVPLRHGAGTRLKILEYFAASLPVVATSKAVEGLGLQPGVEAWIEDDIERLAGAVARLLDSPALAERLGRRGRWSVESRDWRAVTRQQLEVVLVPRPGRARGRRPGARKPDATTSATSARSAAGSPGTAARTPRRRASETRHGRRDARTRPRRSAGRGP